VEGTTAKTIATRRRKKGTWEGYNIPARLRARAWAFRGGSRGSKKKKKKNLRKNVIMEVPLERKEPSTKQIQIDGDIVLKRHQRENND